MVSEERPEDSRGLFVRGFIATWLQYCVECRESISGLVVKDTRESVCGRMPTGVVHRRRLGSFSRKDADPRRGVKAAKPPKTSRPFGGRSCVALPLEESC